MDYFPWHVWVGLVGMTLVLLAHFLLQIRKLHGTGTTYQLLNALGGLGVLVSLVANKVNLVAILLAVVWVLISIYGIVFGFRRNRDARDAHRHDPW